MAISLLCIHSGQQQNHGSYSGVPRDLKRRVYEHSSKLAEALTTRYNIIMLLYCQIVQDVENAIMREKKDQSGLEAKEGLI